MLSATSPNTLAVALQARLSRAAPSWSSYPRDPCGGPPPPPDSVASPVEAAAVAPPVARRPCAALAVLAATVLGAVISSWPAVSLGGAPPVVRPPFPLLKLVSWLRLGPCG